MSHSGRPKAPAVGAFVCTEKEWSVALNYYWGSSTGETTSMASATHDPRCEFPARGREIRQVPIRSDGRTLNDHATPQALGSE